MSNYESTFIASPDVPTEKLDELIEKAKKIVTQNGGEVVIAQQLGKKRLAYPIKKFKEGSYVYLELKGSGAMVGTLENYFHVTDAVIRYLTIKAEKKKAVVRPAAETAPAAAPAPAATGEVKKDEPSQPSAS